MTSHWDGLSDALPVGVVFYLSLQVFPPGAFSAIRVRTHETLATDWEVKFLLESTVVHGLSVL